MNKQLPVYDILPELLSSLENNNSAILQAPPGAGKSTALPLEFLNLPWLAGKKIIMLEPRRLAARAVAFRLAEQLGEEPGKTVGYRIRFESKVSSQTRIEVVTEGILTRMLQKDNILEDVGMVIFDEFHERSLHADLSLMFCRETQQVRNDLRILIMSATLDGQELSSKFNAPLIISEGRQHSVKIIYTGSDERENLAVQTVELILKAIREQKGDILTFLPGAREILQCKEILEDRNTGCEIHPLYGDLNPSQQQLALRPGTKGNRKIILSTSIAETSLTIEGITTVVDSGFTRVSKFDPSSGLTKLQTVKISVDSADQRAGRAGRLGPGVCYRLWSEGSHSFLTRQRKPEILEADLSSLILELINWGVKDFENYPWISQPPKGSIIGALELLRSLKAIDNLNITSRGKRILELPAHPRIAHMLLEAEKKNHLPLACDLAALLEEKDPIGNEKGTDIFYRLDTLLKFRQRERVHNFSQWERIEKVSASWRKIMKTRESATSFIETDAGFLIACAYPERIAKRISAGRYKLSSGRTAKIKDDDTLAHEEWIAIANMDSGSNEGKIFIAAALDPEDLIDFASEKEIVQWDDTEKFIQGKRVKLIGNLPYKSTPLDKIPEEKKNDLFIDLLKKNRLKSFSDYEKYLQWNAKINSLKKWRPDLKLPDVDEKILLENPIWIENNLKGLRKAEELFALSLLTLIQAQISWEDKRLIDQLAPPFIEVPTGSRIELEYQADGSSPILAVRLQELFGMHETPTVNEGRIKVMLHLLSPAYRPVQVTQDLKSFWNTTYSQVRKELRMKYPKHSWPEDPWTAQAVRGALKRKK